MDSEARNEVVDQMVAITAADGDLGRRSCEELLRASDWNIEKAINLHYSAPTPSTPHRRQLSPARPASPRRTTSSSSYPPSPPNNRNQTTPIVARLGLGTVYGLFLPIRFVLRILIGFWYMLARSIIPNSILSILPRLLIPPSSQGRIQPNSTRPKPFIQSLREDYTPSPVDLDRLPDFSTEPYKEFLRGIRSDPKLGVVILCCGEHEDDEVFKREVLLNEELGRVFREKNIAVWAGDVRDREAYQVAQTLQITTYPSLTFFSLLPPSTGSTATASVSNAKLTILSTISGSPSTTTSLPSILHLLDSTLIPRSQPFLARVKRERRALEESRRVREDQDRRAAESAKRDNERIMASRREREERERLEKEEIEKRERAERDKQDKEAREKKMRDDLTSWRRYQRRRLGEMVEPPVEDVKAGQAVRIQLRLPQGNGQVRNIKVFRKDDESLVDISRWAESLLLPSGSSDTLDQDPAAPPSGFVDPYTATVAGSSDVQVPMVKLFTSYPRKQVTLGESGAWDIIVQGGGSLIVEVDRSSDRPAGEDEDSEYETDEDE